jgi:hypothetical protein
LHYHRNLFIEITLQRFLTCGLSVIQKSQVMKYLTYTLLLAMLVALAACKKDNIEPAKNSGIPKEGLELLTTDADTSYFIWAEKKDTMMYKCSEGSKFSMVKSFAYNDANGTRIHYGSTVLCPTGPYKSISIKLNIPVAANQVLDSAIAEQLLVPGRYNIGEKAGEVFMMMDSRAYALQGWTDVSSTNTPVELVSVTKVGFKSGRNIYRVRGRIVAKCQFGCPIVWISMYQGAFQFDTY